MKRLKRVNFKPRNCPTDETLCHQLRVSTLKTEFDFTALSLEATLAQHSH